MLASNNLTAMKKRKSSATPKTRKQKTASQYSADEWAALDNHALRTIETGMTKSFSSTLRLARETWDSIPDRPVFAANFDNITLTRAEDPFAGEFRDLIDADARERHTEPFHTNLLTSLTVLRHLNADLNVYVANLRQTFE